MFLEAITTVERGEFSSATYLATFQVVLWKSYTQLIVFLFKLVEPSRLGSQSRSSPANCEQLWREQATEWDRAGFSGEAARKPKPKHAGVSILFSKKFFFNAWFGLKNYSCLVQFFGLNMQSRNTCKQRSLST